MICILNILYYHPVSEATPNSKITGAYSPLNISAKTLGRKTEESTISTPASICPHPGMPQEKKTFRLMFLPLL